MDDQRKVVTILHTNDAYHLNPVSDELKLGGAARFRTAVRQFEDREPLVTFGGDIFSPSEESSRTKGKCMVDALNLSGIQYSVIGNHEFDKGLPECLRLLSEASNVQWVVSNLVDRQFNQLAGTHPYCTTRRNGVLIGIIGLIEEEWISTLSIDHSLLAYSDFITSGRELATFLKNQLGVDMVVALTHMRMPNDQLLADQVKEIDVILGGHDHFFQAEFKPDSMLAKAGQEFERLLVLELEVSPRSASKRVNLAKFGKVEVDTRLDVDPEMQKLIDDQIGQMEKELSTVLAILDTPFDTGTSVVRLQEAAIGNFMADVFCAEQGADCAIVTGGTFRGGAKYEPGPFRLRNLTTIFPFPNKVVLLEATGQQIWDALENGFSQLPKEEGRFPQVSNLVVTYDPTAPAKQRVKSVQLGTPNDCRPINLETKYLLATTNYTASGNEEFSSLKSCKRLIDEDDCVSMCDSVLKFWREARIKNTVEHPVLESALESVCKTRTASTALAMESPAAVASPQAPRGVFRAIELPPYRHRRARKRQHTTMESVEETSQSSADVLRWPQLHRAAKEAKDQIKKEDVLPHFAPKVEGRLIVVSKK